MGNLAQQSQDLAQTTNMDFGREDLKTFVTEFSNHISELNLDPARKRKAEAQLGTLKAQLADEPDPTIVQQAGKTLRNITEGAIGSLIATAAQPGIWHLIQGILSQFPTH